MNNGLLNTSIDYLKGVGPNRAKLLKKELKIYTFQDLLSFFPYRYIDKTKYHKIEEINNIKSEIKIIAKIVDIYETGAPRKKRLIAKVQDDTGILELVWFKSHKWIKENITLNKNYIIYGKPNLYKGIYNIPHPELELYKKENIYDLFLVIKYNTNPIIKKRGSAIFLHIAKKNYKPTAGCIAISKRDFIKILPLINNKTLITIN